jgi:HSP20 family protein
MTSCCVPVRETAAEATAPTFVPRLDIVETDEAFRVDVDVPGASKDDVEVDVEKGILSIQARVPARDGEGRRYHLRELGPRTLARRLRLGETIDVDAITAEVSRGVLTIRLPKVPAAKPRRIELS